MSDNRDIDGRNEEVEFERKIWPAKSVLTLSCRAGRCVLAGGSSS